jgi:hypothetical protein
MQSLYALFANNMSKTSADIFLLIAAFGYIANFVVRYLADRLVFHRFLSGKWTGNLIHKDESGNNMADIDCIFYINRNSNNVAGLLRFWRVGENLKVEGIDEVITAEHINSFLLSIFGWRNSFSLQTRSQFIIVNHKDISNYARVYDFQGKVIDHIFRSRIFLSVKVEDKLFEGYFTREHS